MTVYAFGYFVCVTFDSVRFDPHFAVLSVPPCRMIAGGALSV